jgi:hypothetical protein
MNEEISDAYSLSCDATPFPDFEMMATRFGESPFGEGTIYQGCFFYRSYLMSVRRRDPLRLLDSPRTRLKETTFLWAVQDWTERLDPIETFKAAKALRATVRFLMPGLVGSPRQKRRSAGPEAAWIYRVLDNLEAEADAYAKARPDTVAVDEPVPQRPSQPEAWLVRLQSALIKKTGRDGKPSRRAAHPISDISKGNAEGDIRRFLFANSVNEPVDDLDTLINASSIERYRLSIHDPDDCWRDAERLRALRFAFQHAAPDVSLEPLNAAMKAIRTAHPRPPKRIRNPRKAVKARQPPRVFASNVPDAEVAILEQALAKDAIDFLKENEEFPTLSDSHKNNLRRVWWAFHTSLLDGAKEIREMPPANRDYEKGAKHFLAWLAPSCRPRTRATRLRELKSALDRMFGRHFEFMAKWADELNASDPPTEVWVPNVSTEDLKRAGLAMMDDAWRRIVILQRYPEKKRIQKLQPLAERYRNGLIIFILSTLPLRLRNLSSLMNGFSLYWATNHFVIHVEADDTKTGKTSVVTDVPDEYSERIQRYLDLVRPLIWKAFDPKILWVSREHGPLTPTAFQRIVPSSTFEFEGVWINCHMFRHIRATEESGNSQVSGAARAALGHTAGGVAARRYEDKKKKWALAAAAVAHEREPSETVGDRDRADD